MRTYPEIKKLKHLQSLFTVYTTASGAKVNFIENMSVFCTAGRAVKVKPGKTPLHKTNSSRHGKKP